ncbi:MAG: type II secretion system protein [Candidatus Riflebacteria bacterium]|nr:type II secretion system protein [Candidatus Riflebacteria bacterium]
MIFSRVYYHFSEPLSEKEVHNLHEQKKHSNYDIYLLQHPINRKHLSSFFNPNKRRGILDIGSGIKDKRFPEIGRQAMTLIELLVAMVIFSIAMLPIMGLFGRGAVSTQMTTDYLSAMQMSSSYLRGLANLPVADIPIGDPVALEKNFGSLTTNKLFIPQKAIINGNTFTNKLQVTYVMRDPVKKDFWFEFMDQPGHLASMTAYKQFLRMDFEVTWKSKNTGQDDKLKLFAYKADLE